MKYEDIKDFAERCEIHPDHQSGMISESMLKQRLHEEIDELRAYIEQRTWVGLTDAEVMDIAFNFDVPSLVVRTVEAKLKEKNT